MSVLTYPSAQAGSANPIPQTTPFGGALKNYYTRLVEDIVPIITPLWSQYQKIKKGGARNFRWGGLGPVWNLVVGDVVGHSYSDAGWLPDSNFRGRVQARDGIKRLYARKQFDRVMDSATASGDGSYESLLSAIDEEFQTHMALGIQEGLHGDGRGIKAIVTNVVNSTTFDAANPYGITSSAGQGSLWLVPGQRLTVRQSTGTARSIAGGAGAVIQSITLQTAPDIYRIVVDNAVTSIAATDLLIGATQFDDAWNGLPNGLLNMSNRGGAFDTLHQVSGASNATPGGSPNGSPRHNTTRLDASAATTTIQRPDQLTDPDLTDLCMRVAAKSGKNPMLNPTEWLLVTTPGLKKGYKESKVAFTVGAMSQQQLRQLNGGWGYDADFNGIPILDDPYCPLGTVYLLHLPSLGWIDAEDWGVVRMDGMDAYRPVPNSDNYETSRGIYFNTVCTARNTIGLITGYTETSARYTPVAA